MRAFLAKVRKETAEFLLAWRHRSELNAALTARQTLAADHILDGTLCNEELELLEEFVIASNPDPGPIIEIGTLFGLTTVQMAAWKVPGKQIITVDNYSWNPWHLDLKTHLLLTSRVLYALTRTGQVVQLVTEKQEFYYSYRGARPSLVFLDAIHSYEETAADIAWAKRLDAEIICGHDYDARFPGVVRAVDNEGGPARLIGSLWVLRGRS